VSGAVVLRSAVAGATGVSATCGAERGGGGVGVRGATTAEEVMLARLGSTVMELSQRSMHGTDCVGSLTAVRPPSAASVSERHTERKERGGHAERATQAGGMQTDAQTEATATADAEACENHATRRRRGTNNTTADINTRIDMWDSRHA